MWRGKLRHLSLLAQTGQTSEAASCTLFLSAGKRGRRAGVRSGIPVICQRKRHRPDSTRASLPKQLPRQVTGPLCRLPRSLGGLHGGGGRGWKVGKRPGGKSTRSRRREEEGPHRVPWGNRFKGFSVSTIQGGKKMAPSQTPPDLHTHTPHTPTHARAYPAPLSPHFSETTKTKGSNR